MSEWAIISTSIVVAIWIISMLLLRDIQKVEERVRELESKIEKPKMICPHCNGMGWYTKMESDGISEVIYNVTCNYCNETGIFNKLRENAIKSGVDLVGRWKG